MINIQTPTKLSPLHTVSESLHAHFVERDGWQVADVYSMVPAEMEAAQQRVALADVSDGGKITLEGSQAAAVLAQVWGTPALEINGGTAVADGICVYKLRRDLFLAITPAAGVGEATSALETAARQIDDLITVTNVTHGRAALQLVGPGSAELLSRLCGLDFYETQFPNLTARQSSVAKTAQTIIRNDVGEIPAYTLIGARSLAAYLWETALEAGHDLGIVSLGRAALETMSNEQ